MAQIRIVDDWLRSPAAGPSHWRSVMVIAERWAEQRVLMRAYAESRDQLRPTLVLHGIELAIGPAGLDLNGPWGIHVGDNPDGRAQEIKLQLESSARRLAGSKGNPPRLVDEESPFDADPTAHWGPGAPRVLPRPAPQPPAPAVDGTAPAVDGTALPFGSAASRGSPAVEHVTPVAAARVHQVQAATYVAQSQSPAQASAAPPHEMAAPSNPELRSTPLRARTRTRQPTLSSSPPPSSPLPAQPPGRTVLGYTSGSGAQSAIVRLGLVPQVSARLGWLVDRVVPPEFHIDAPERRILNALGERELTARGVAQMLEVADPVSFMEELTRKLEAYNLDLIQPGEPQGGEPTYRLRA